MTVTVNIFGLPASCPSSASESSCIDPPPVAQLEETLGALDVRAENRILATFDELSPNDQLFIIVYAKNFKTVESRIRRLKKVLHKNIDHVTFLKSTPAKDEIKVFRVPPGATPPTP